MPGRVSGWDGLLLRIRDFSAAISPILCSINSFSIAILSNSNNVVIAH